MPIALVDRTSIGVDCGKLTAAVCLGPAEGGLPLLQRVVFRYHKSSEEAPWCLATAAGQMVSICRQLEKAPEEYPNARLGAARVVTVEDTWFNPKADAGWIDPKAITPLAAQVGALAAWCALETMPDTEFRVVSPQKVSSDVDIRKAERMEKLGAVIANPEVVWDMDWPGGKTADPRPHIADACVLASWGGRRARFADIMRDTDGGFQNG